MKYQREELCLIWLDSFSRIDYKRKVKLYEIIKDSDKISESIKGNKEYIVSLISESEYNLLLNSANEQYLKYVLNELEERDITVVTINSKTYPKKLKETPYAPLNLYVKGDEKLLNAETIGIVGSRRSLPYSIGLAEDYASEITESGIAIVTGTAEGVDSAVINGALKKGGKVISVVAGGFDYIYPSVNKNLIERVIETGLVVSEYPPSVRPKPYFFPNRNRIIAALGMGVVIISGAKKSGTFYTAEYADEYSRDVFCVPYNSNVASGYMCNELIKCGAILTTSPEDVLEYYGIKKQTKEVALKEDEKEIINLLKDGSKHIEEICEETGKEIYELTATLTNMEINGIVIETGMNEYGLKRNDLEE